jgi:hypothetical protein
MATPEEQVIHYAKVWYETEKTAMYAAVGKKNKADKAHDEAKKRLRNAVCRLPGVDDETPESPKP